MSDVPPTAAADAEATTPSAQGKRPWLRSAVWIAALVFSLGGLYAWVRWRTEAHGVSRATLLARANVWLGSSGAFAAVAGQVVRTAPETLQTSVGVITAEHGYLEDGAVVQGGDLALVYYRHDGGERARPFLTRLSAEFEPRFTVALNGDRDTSCGTGYVARQLAGFTDTLWISEVAAERSAQAVHYVQQLRRFDTTGRELQPVTVCGRCTISKLWTSPQHAVALVVRSSGDFPNNVVDYELNWFEVNGNPLGRITIGSSAFGPAQLDATGAVIALTTGPFAPCKTTQPALVRISASGCTASLPLAAFLPESSDPWTLALRDSEVYFFARSEATPLQRWFHRWSPDTDMLTIYRLGVETDRFVLRDQRVLESDYTSNGAAAWSEGQLLLLDGSPSTELTLRALQYPR